MAVCALQPILSNRIFSIQIAIVTVKYYRNKRQRFQEYSSAMSGQLVSKSTFFLSRTQLVLQYYLVTNYKKRLFPERIINLFLQEGEFRANWSHG